MSESTNATEPESKPENWHVYVVRCADGALYTGIATDVARRFGEHSSGKGAKALRGRGPLHLVLERLVGPRGLALRVEHRVKQLSKAEKERVVSAPEQLERLVTLVRDAQAT